jgi:RimJ/RimL family protein N-acetyltransferase
MIDDLDGRPFGYMGLAQIDWDRRYGEADAIVRGRAEPRGVMGSALEEMLQWASSSLGLDRLAVRVRSDNAALSFYSRVGFRESRRVPLRFDELREPPAYVEDDEAQTALAVVYMEYSRGRSA